MRQLFLSSSASILIAGTASADVTVSGDGRMGLLYLDSAYQNAISGDEKSYNFTSRIRIEFTASGETDGGLAFGGSIRVDQQDSFCTGTTRFRADDAGTIVLDNDGNPVIDTGNSCSDTGGTNGTAGEVFISGEFGKLAMGDVDGGTEVVVGDLAFESLTGLGDYNEMAYLFGQNDPSALYEYSAGGLTLALAVSDDEEFAAGVGYYSGTWSVGLGYEKVPGGNTIQLLDPDVAQIPSIYLDNANTVDQLIGAGSFTVSDITFKAAYGQVGTDQGDVDQYGVSVESSYAEWTFAAFYRRLDGLKGFVTTEDVTIEDDGIELYGIGAQYDLGGGAAVTGGVASIEGENAADLGIKFEF